MAKTPTATPAPIPARIPPFGRENPRGAREYLALLPKNLIRVTEAQNTASTRTAIAASSATTESRSPRASATGAPEVDLVRSPSAIRVGQEPLLYGGRQECYVPQLIDAHPTDLPPRRLRAGLDLGIAPQDSLIVAFQDHARDDVDRVPSLAQELAHVEYPGEAGRKARLLGELAARALRYRLARIEPSPRQHPVRLSIRFLVAHQEQIPPTFDHRRDPHPEVHAVRCAVLAHTASIPAPQNPATKNQTLCRAGREPPYGSPSSMGTMIPSVSTNSGGEAANQAMNSATRSGARTCIGGASFGPPSLRSSGEKAPQLVAIAPG